MTRRIERDLLAAGERVVRVRLKLMAQVRDAARTYDKSDPIDALAVHEHPAPPTRSAAASWRPKPALGRGELARRRPEARLRPWTHAAQAHSPHDGVASAGRVDCDIFLERWRRLRRRSSATAQVVRWSDRPVVVAALPLKSSAREHLARCLGDVELRDIRDDVLTADLVLTPSCSPQAIAALRHAYPASQLVVVELDDDAWDVHSSGPVQRLLGAGADAYLTANSIVNLSDQLLQRKEQSEVEADEQTMLEEPSSVDSWIMTSVADLSRRRAETKVVGRRELDR